MASHLFNVAKRKILRGELAFHTADMRVALLSTNTTADTQNDGISFIADLTTLDEFDGAGYVRKALANEAVNLDDPNDRAEFDADNVTWSSLGAGTRSVQGLLLYVHVTNDADSIPVAWIEFASVKTPDGSDFTVNWDAEGILQAA